MTSLVVAEHDNAGIKPSTLNTITAAMQCGGDVHVLIAGHNAGGAAAAAAAVVGHRGLSNHWTFENRATCPLATYRWICCANENHHSLELHLGILA